MNMMTMTAATLSQTCEEAVPELYVVVAKNSIIGLDSQAIAELLGCPKSEVEELCEDELYKKVRLLLSQAYAQGKLDTDFGWDALEQTALKNLNKRMAFEQDPDFNLRVAAVANKAQRRISEGPKVLDPSSGAVMVPISLTSRFVKKLNMRTGEASIEETRSVSLTDGTAVNPSFEDIDKMFGVSARPQVVSGATTRTIDGEIDVEALAQQWLDGKIPQ